MPVPFRPFREEPDPPPAASVKSAPDFEPINSALEGLNPGETATTTNVDLASTAASFTHVTGQNASTASTAIDTRYPWYHNPCSATSCTTVYFGGPTGTATAAASAQQASSPPQPLSEAQTIALVTIILTVLGMLVSIYTLCKKYRARRLQASKSDHSYSTLDGGSKKDRVPVFAKPKRLDDDDEWQRH